MGYFPDVNAGDPFIPNAGLSNAVRHIVNALNGFQSDAIPAKNMSIIRVSVYNASNAAFSAGQAISIDLEGEIIHDAYPAVAYDEDLPCFGVCVSGATAGGGISDCVLTGIANVIISGGTATSYAKPVSDGTFETSDDEGFRIINISGGTSAVILMGDYVKTGGSNYAPGIGITITGGTEGEPYKINANITGDGDNIVVSGGSAGNPLVISYIGSGGGGSSFAVPPYSALSFGGGAPEYGLGHTFILAVKAGAVGFYDDGGGAVGKWTNKAGTTSQYITGGTSYHATEDGWLRISVVDNGLAPGRCLGFYSPTGGFPLYKYGSFSVSGIGYPDYIALAGGTASNALGTITDEDYEEGITPVPGPSTMPQNPKLGITNFLPVPAGTPIKYYASTAVLVRFAPVWGGGGGHFYYDLSNELEWTPNCAGWLRVSILDDGTHSSDCFRLYVGGVQWSDAVPLYKCGTFQGGATGISASISGGTASITLSGGTGSVKLLGSGSITISGGSNGEIIIHGATSGGGGGDDAVIIYQEEHTESGQITAQTNKKYYIALFDALYYDAESYNYVCQYYITYDRSTTPYTIVRHKTDYNDLEAYWDGDGYSFELVLPAPNEDCFLDICLFAFSTILISSTKPIYNYQGAPCLQPYMISNRDVKLVYIANDNGGRWYLYGN